MSLVNVSIVGNVVKPPAQTCFSSGNTKTTLIIAVNNPGKKADKPNATAEFFRVEAWGKLGEVAHRYIEKGNQVAATGRLVLDKWQDREGRDRVTAVVHAYQISLPPKPRGDSAYLEAQANGHPTNPIDGEIQFSEDDDDSAMAHFAEATAS